MDQQLTTGGSKSSAANTHRCLAETNFSTARSQVRSFMRSKDATPLIDRRGCIQHETVFVAKLRSTDATKPLAMDVIDRPAMGRGYYEQSEEQKIYR